MPNVASGLTHSKPANSPSRSSSVVMLVYVTSSDHLCTPHYRRYAASVTLGAGHTLYVAVIPGITNN